MGFFKNIGSFFGKGVEKLGDFIGSTTLSTFGQNIQNFCSEKIASEKSYDKREANIYTTDRLNEILVSFSEGYFQQASYIENSCISRVEEYYDKLISIIENTPSITYNNANLKSLKANRNRIAKSIAGGIKNPLAKRMSLDDLECLSILKMDSGLEKKNAMTKFTQKIIKDALNNLAKNVRESLNDQTEDIFDYLKNISEEQEKEMITLKNHVDKLVRDCELEQSNKEDSCVLALFILEASEQVYEIIK